MDKGTCNTINSSQFINACSFFSFFLLLKSIPRFFSLFLSYSAKYPSLFFFFINYFLSLFFLSLSLFIYSFLLRFFKLTYLCSKSDWTEQKTSKVTNISREKILHFQPFALLVYNFPPSFLLHLAFLILNHKHGLHSLN